MSYNKYYSPTTWEDFPSENTAIDAQRLNHLEDGVDELDDRICALDVNKTQVSWNQQLLTGDKIAEISINGVVKNVYAPNVDGASQQAQAAALVSEGHAQGTQGGSAVGPGSQYYHNNAKYYAEQASASFDNKIASEGYALGTENGDPVPSGSIYYHNNAKFYAEEARHFTPEGYQDLVDGVHDFEERGYLGKNKVALSLEPGYTQTLNGITYTVNDDYSITANGTATAQSNAYIYGVTTITDSSLQSYGNIKEGDILSGCPLGGSESTYMLLAGNNTLRYGIDTGQGVELRNLTSEGIRILIRVNSGVTVDDAVFRLMVRNKMSNDGYEPYILSNNELNDKIEDMSDLSLSVPEQAYSLFLLRKNVRLSYVDLPHDATKANENQISDINQPVNDPMPTNYAVRNYSKGEHFMQKGYFCTALTDIAMGATLTLNTNYKREKITDYLSNVNISEDLTWNETNLSFAHKSANRYGNVVTINVRFTVNSTVQNLPIITGVPEKYMPIDGWYFGNVIGQWNGSNVGIVGFKLENDNRFYSPNPAGFQVGQNYIGTFTYICKGV